MNLVIFTFPCNSEARTERDEVFKTWSIREFSSQSLRLCWPWMVGAAPTVLLIHALIAISFIVCNLPYVFWFDKILWSAVNWEHVVTLPVVCVDSGIVSASLSSSNSLADNQVLTCINMLSCWIEVSLVDLLSRQFCVWQLLCSRFLSFKISWLRSLTVSILLPLLSSWLGSLLPPSSIVLLCSWFGYLIMSVLLPIQSSSLGFWLALRSLLSLCSWVESSTVSVLLLLLSWLWLTSVPRFFSLLSSGFGCPTVPLLLPLLSSSLWSLLEPSYLHLLRSWSGSFTVSVFKTLMSFSLGSLSAHRSLFPQCSWLWSFITSVLLPLPSSWLWTLLPPISFSSLCS